MSSSSAASSARAVAAPARPRARGRAPRACARSSLSPAQPVDRAMLRGRHQPGAGLVGNARRRPLLERRDERVLRQLLGEADVAHHAREAGDELRRLDAPDRVDRAMDVRNGCIGSHHGYRSAIVVRAGTLAAGASGYHFAAFDRISWREAASRALLGGKTSARSPRIEDRAELALAFAQALRGSAWSTRSPPPSSSPRRWRSRRPAPSTR